MAHRIEPLFLELWLIELNSFLWLIELNLFLSMIQRIESLFEYDSKNRIFFEAKKTHRIEPFFSPTETNPSFQYDAKNWTFLVFQHDSKNWIFFESIKKKLNRISRIWLKELRTNFVKNDAKNWTFFSIRLNDLNLFLEYDPQNWTFFQYDWKNSELFKNYDSLNWTFLQKKKMTQRMFWKVKNVSKNWFFEYNSQNWTLFFDMTYRIEPIFSTWLIEFFFTKILTHRNDWSCLEKWLKELNPFLNMTQRIELKKKSKIWTLFKKKKNDSKNWTFFECNSKSWIFWVWLEERNFFFFSKKWLKELKSLEHDSKNCFFFECDSKNWIFEFVKKKKKRLKELSFSQKYDTKNWTSFQYVSKIFFNMTRRIEPFFITWFKDLVFSHQKKNSKNFFFQNSQTWTF